MIDTDYLDARPPGRTAIVREIVRGAFPEICAGPNFGPWEATPRGDGGFGVRRVDAGLSIISDRFATEAEAREAADELNRALKQGGAR